MDDTVCKDAEPMDWMEEIVFLDERLSSLQSENESMPASGKDLKRFWREVFVSYGVQIVADKLTTYPYSSGNPLQPQQPSSHFPNSIYFIFPELLSQLQHSSKVRASLISGVGGAVIAPGGGRVGSSLTAGGPRSSIRTFEQLYHPASNISLF